MIENEWVGRTARHGAPDFMRDAAEYRDVIQREAEIDKLPEGIALSSERIQAVQDIQLAVTDFAIDRLGVDISSRLFPVTKNNIRFYDEAMGKQAAEAIGLSDKKHRGFTTVTGFIGLEEGVNEGETLIATQHELMHRLAVRQSFIWSDERQGTVSIRPWRSGVSTPDKFTVLEEAIVVELTRKVKDQVWSHYQSLAPFAATVEPGLAAMAHMGKGEYDNGIVYCALFEAMCQAASERIDKDVEGEFYAMQFNGDRTALHDLSRAFGNQAVTELSGLDLYTVKSSDIISFVDRLNLKDQFMDRLADYKKLVKLNADSH